ncbi:MAG TPA: hypothetical protein VHG27_00170 [Xanthobacteraceae bacterium]|nr:hypothetical protein [Xanthobacteraceae bacterium]
MKQIVVILAGACSPAAPTLRVLHGRCRASDERLAGAALNSFMQKCERGAKSACEKQAADRKLAGAAKTSFTTKCV